MPELCFEMSTFNTTLLILLLAVFQVHTRLRLQDYGSEKYDTDCNL